MTARLLAVTLVGVSALATTASSAPGAEFLGACYCRAAGQLSCVAELTRSECNRRCAEALCDEWFWLERRPCWNWGYGG
jgi:hypothetical protein